MQLYLVHNDPLNTLFVTQDGEPLYSAHTFACDRLPADLYPTSPAHPRFSRPSSDSSASSSGSSNFSGLSDASLPSTSSFQTSPARSSAASFIKPSLPQIPIPPYRFTPQSISAPTSSPSSPLPKYDQPSFDTLSPHFRFPIARTHSSPHPDTLSQQLLAHSASPPTLAGPGPLTSVKRLERHRVSRGNVETEVGRIEDYGEDIGTRVNLCHIGMTIKIGGGTTPTKRTPSSNGDGTAIAVASDSRALSCRNEIRGDAPTALQAFLDFGETLKQKRESASMNHQGGEVEVKEEAFVPDPTWDFTGSDGKSYKWLCLARCPVLVHNSQPVPTPIARYRPAKLGIVSRARRGFLEILPAGLELEDMIVVTFVAYSRMRLNRMRGKGQHAMSVCRPPPLSVIPSPSPSVLSSSRASPEPLVHQQSSKQKNPYLNGIPGHHS